MSFLPSLDKDGFIVGKRNKEKVKLKAPLKNPLIPNDTDSFRFQESANFCKRCNGRLYVVVRSKVPKKQKKKAYYFTRWERCWDCGTFYMDESSKVINHSRTKKDKKAKVLGPKEYVGYIRSLRWHKRLRRYFAMHGGTCEICGSREDLNLHHKTYVRLGCELDSDLVPLCGLHHDEFHSLYGTFKDMTLATDTYIQSKKHEIEAQLMINSF